MWNDLRLIGRVKSSQKDYPEIGLSWMEEWGISKIVQTTFEDLGYDEEEASRGLTILRLLINQQNWIMDQDLASARRTLETWLSSDEIRRFLNINRYKEILWFNKEAFEALLWWMMTIGLLSLTSEPDRSHTEIVEKVIQAFQLIKDLLIAEEASEYQVEKLLEALK